MMSVNVSNQSVERPSAEVIDLCTYMRRAPPVEAGPRREAMEASLRAIETKLVELAGAVDLASHEAALSPLLLEAILRAIAALQASVRSYGQAPFAPPDSAG